MLIEFAPMDKLAKSSPFHGGDSEFEPRWEYHIVRTDS